MVARGTIALLVALVVVGGLQWAPAQVADGAPTLVVENRADTTYRVTGYVAPDPRAATFVNFAVTAEDGERRLAPLSQLVWAGEFRNVTLADPEVPATSVTVAPGENATTRLRGWEPGEIPFYLAEDLGDDQRHVWTEVGDCTRPGQELTVTFGDGTSWSSSCTSGPGWLLP